MLQANRKAPNEICNFCEQECNWLVYDNAIVISKNLKKYMCCTEDIYKCKNFILDSKKGKGKFMKSILTNSTTYFNHFITTLDQIKPFIYWYKNDFRWYTNFYMTKVLHS